MDPQSLPVVIIDTTQILWAHALIQVMSTKNPTDSCVSAAKTRITFDSMPTPPLNLDGQPDLDTWMRTIYQGVPLEFEIKTALFLAKTRAGDEVFVAVHVPAQKALSSNGVIKAELREKLGVEIVGDLDKSKALSRLNANFRPMLDNFQEYDRVALEGIKEGGKQIYIDALEAHIADPNVKFGELNPWTLLMLAVYSHSKTWQELGVKETRIIHLVDEELTTRKGVSTTNAGSKYMSMTLKDTSVAFELVDKVLQEIYGDSFQAYAASGKIIRQPGVGCPAD